MSELTSAVNELLKGKRAEENLHIYTDGLSALYKRMAHLRMAMNYFTFAEVYSDMDVKDKVIFDVQVNKLQKMIDDIILLDKADEYKAEDIETFRNEIIAIMEVLTAYVDRLQVCEYILNRVEFRYEECDYGNDYYNDKFEKDIYRYITSDKDNTVINMKLSQIIGQIPMRLSKNKFFDMLRDSFSLYKGSEQQSVDDFAYMIRTAGTIYNPEGFGTMFTDLHSQYEQLASIKAEDITEERFREYRELLTEASEVVERYSDFYVMLAEIVNDVYTIYLNNGALTEVNEIEMLKSIISDSYDMLEGHDIESEAVAMKFMELEGIQERLSNMIFNPESAIDEICNINGGLIDEAGYRSRINSLIVTSKLQSASTFAKLKDDDDKKMPADEAYIMETVDSLVTDFSKLFEEKDRSGKRAVMALVVSALPTFFNNLEEFKQYVHVALSQCTDMAEKQACMSLINLMMASE